MTITAAEIDTAVARGKREILVDIANGTVPETVASFGQLHDFVDANEYGGLTELPFYDEAGLDDPEIDTGIVDPDAGNEVQNRLDAWIKSGMPEDEKES